MKSEFIDKADVATYVVVFDPRATRPSPVSRRRAG